MIWWSELVVLNVQNGGLQVQDWELLWSKQRKNNQPFAESLTDRQSDQSKMQNLPEKLIRQESRWTLVD